MSAVKMTPCAKCGMPCDPREYHPFAACLMFEACHSSESVRANLEAIKQEATRQAMEAAAEKCEEIANTADDGSLPGEFGGLSARDCVDAIRSLLEGPK